MKPKHPVFNLSSAQVDAVFTLGPRSRDRILYTAWQVIILASESKTSARFLQLVGVACWLIPILVISALWLSVVRAYYVREIHVSDVMVQEARDLPQDSVLEEMKDFDFLEDHWPAKPELVDAASRLLDGELKYEGCSARIAMPFKAQDLDRVPENCQLPLAGFFAPDLLLRAYGESGRPEFLSAAEAYIVAAHKYERAAWFPRAQFWNDHAVSARIGVLTNFWRLYRHSPNYQVKVARQILSMAARTEALLAKPGQFTSATNHGVMQNLALWQASLAFPSLPHTQEYQRLALTRLNDQMKFYVSEEGVVLEHSAGYQLFGLERLSWAFRYLDLMGQTAPAEWIEKYDRAKAFYAALRRPDGSLPTFGDTDDATDSLGPRIAVFDPERRARQLVYQPEWRPAAAVSLYPVSGYSIWWDGLDSPANIRNLSQTVVSWSNFAGHGHKHADEMSLLFWAGGQTWWSNVGYWPYASESRSTGESWPGSNAPHLTDESFSAPRTASLVSTGSVSNLTFLELERSGAGSYLARRQVIHWTPNLWVVLDSTSSKEQNRTTTTWTTPSNVLWQQRADGSFLLKGDHSEQQIELFVVGSPGAQQKLFRGSVHPFAGWQVESGRPTPASALVIEQPAQNSWAAAVWSLQPSGNASALSGRPQMTNWADATNWEMRLPAAGGETTLRRQGNKVLLHPDRGTDTALELRAPPDINSQLAELNRNFGLSAARYPRFYENTPKRWKVTYLLIGIFVLQQLFFLVYKFLVYKRGLWPHPEIFRLLSLIAWIAGGIWVVNFYL
jgi:Heparinase II/III N-terminus/Heparinase II/III-like protein